MGQDANGKVFVSVVTLRPRVIIGGKKTANDAELATIHHEAHGRATLPIPAGPKCDASL